MSLGEAATPAPLAGPGLPSVPIDWHSLLLHCPAAPASLLTSVNFSFAFHKQGSREEELHLGHGLWLASGEPGAQGPICSPPALLDWTLLYD